MLDNRKDTVNDGIVLQSAGLRADGCQRSTCAWRVARRRSVHRRGGLGCAARVHRFVLVHLVFAALVACSAACASGGKTLAPVGGPANPATPATGSGSGTGQGTALDNTPSGFVACSVVGQPTTLGTAQGQVPLGLSATNTEEGYAVAYVTATPSTKLEFARFDTQGQRLAASTPLVHESLAVEAPALAGSGASLLYAFASNREGTYQILARDPESLVDSNVSLGIEPARAVDLLNVSATSYFVVWSESPGGSGARRLYYAQVDESGARSAAPTEWSDARGVTGFLFARRGGSSAAGHALVYSVANSEGSSSDLRLRTISASGVPSASAHTVVAGRVIVGRPTAARLATGGTLVAWTEQNGVRYEVHSVQVADNGTQSFAENVYVDEARLEQGRDPALSPLGTYALLVYRLSRRLPAGGNEHYFHASLLHPQGTKLSTDSERDLLAAEGFSAPVSLTGSGTAGLFGFAYTDITSSATSASFAAIDCLGEI